jgi:uncharacterized membrane protein
VSTDPSAGTVQGVESQVIQITFNASLPTGLYLASLLIYNEGNPAPLEVPLSMTVVAESSYSLALHPATASLSAYPADSVTYSLTLENNGNVTDIINLEIMANQWPVHLSEETFILNPNFSSGFSLRVDLPPADTLAKDSDMVIVTAVSSGDASITAAAELTTLVKPRKIFLPLTINQ